MGQFVANANEAQLTEPRKPKKFVTQENDDFPCPYCGATRFVRNETIGKITPSGFTQLEESFICRGCGQTIEQEKIKEYYG